MAKAVEPKSFNSLAFQEKLEMGLLKEFKEFAMRGNVIDLAVGVIMGAAFGKIVESLVKNVITPPIGYLIGGKQFEDLTFALPELTLAGQQLKPVTVNYGAFLQSTFDFVIIAFCVFMLIKGMNMLWKKKAEAPKPAELSTQEKLLIEIRDLLKAKPA
jgi:large conductance mechanosensitive channel